MHAAMSVADVLLTPTTPFPAFPYGAPADTAGLLNDALTVPANLAGVPAISIPVSTVMSSGSIEPGERDGLPVSGTCALPLGMQVSWLATQHLVWALLWAGAIHLPQGVGLYRPCNISIIPVLRPCS